MAVLKSFENFFAISNSAAALCLLWKFWADYAISRLVINQYPQCGSRIRNCKKMLKGFQHRHENALIQSFEMSPQLVCLECGSKTL